MNKLVKHGGLEFLVVNSFKLPPESNFDVMAANAVRQGEKLQRDFYPPKDVLRFADSVGTAEERVGLDERQPDYHHIYAIDDTGKVVGMRVTDEIDFAEFSSMQGSAVMEYVPPLSHHEPVAESLSSFSQHLSKPASAYFARFRLVGEDDSLEAKNLRLMGFSPAGSAPIWVPPLNASTARGYKIVQRESCYMWARFSSGLEPRLPADAAMAFFEKVVVEGWTDERLEKLGLKASELPAVKKTRLSAYDAAVRNGGYVYFK